MVHGYLYYQSGCLSKLKYELNLLQTPSRAHAIQSPQTNDTNNVVIG
jgi:hypothetical protein